jgi:tetratricopeptide (TPR) repeat protein
MRTFALLLTLVLCFASVARAQQPPTPVPTPQRSPLIGSDVFERASAALSAGDYERAAFDYTLLILVNPTFSQGYYGRALSYASQGDFARALPDIERALATAPDSGDYRAGIYTLRAEIYREQENLPAAIADFGAIIALAPSADSYAQRALLQLGTGAFQASIDDLTEAIALADDAPLLYAYRAYARTQIADSDRTLIAADWLQFVTLSETETRDYETFPPSQLQVVESGAGVIHRLPLMGEAGQMFSAAAGGAQGSQTDPLLILLAPDGTPLIADDDTGGGTTALILGYILPETGEYTLIVSHSLGEPTGDIGVQYELGAQ